MSEETEVQGPFALWIDWKEQIVSFRKVDEHNFEIVEFPTNEERFAYVFNHCSKGFRIQ